MANLNMWKNDLITNFKKGIVLISNQLIAQKTIQNPQKFSTARFQCGRKTQASLGVQKYF